MKLVNRSSRSLRKEIARRKAKSRIIRAIEDRIDSEAAVEALAEAREKGTISLAQLKEKLGLSELNVQR